MSDAIGVHFTYLIRTQKLVDEQTDSGPAIAA
jgi:hypothetical protein